MGCKPEKFVDVRVAYAPIILIKIDKKTASNIETVFLIK